MPHLFNKLFNHHEAAEHVKHIIPEATYKDAFWILDHADFDSGVRHEVIKQWTKLRNEKSLLESKKPNCPICNAYRGENPKGHHMHIGDKAWTLCRHCYNELCPANWIEQWEHGLYADWPFSTPHGAYIQAVHEVKRAFKEVKPC